MNCKAFTQNFILSFLLINLSKCSVSNKQVVGKYVENTFGDTLVIHKDKSYDYLERLNSGKVGLTQGNWEMNNREIEFQCNHQPLVGYWKKVQRDSSVNNFQIKLLLGSTEEPIYIESAEVFKNGSALQKDSVEKIKNVVKILTNNYDSIVIQTFNFVNLTFTNSLNPNYGYIVKVFPGERLYELDKVPFFVHRNKLKSIKTKQYNNLNFSFKKIRNDSHF